MHARVLSAGTFGIEAFPVEVEVNVTRSDFGNISLVGLPDAAVKESLERVRAALINTGYHYRVYRLTGNLASTLWKESKAESPWICNAMPKDKAGRTPLGFSIEPEQRHPEKTL